MDLSYVCVRASALRFVSSFTRIAAALSLAATLIFAPSPANAEVPSTRTIGWGTNSDAQLGNMDFDSARTPVKVLGSTPFVDVSAGYAWSMGLSADGRVWTWGDNTSLQLGAPELTDTYTRWAPEPVEGLDRVTKIAAGFRSGAALRTDGTVWTWGAGPTLGIGSAPDRARPGPIPGLNDVVDIAGGGFHMLALRRDGTVLAWGRSPDGQLGDGTVSGATRRPAPVPGLTNVTAISANMFHSLALRADGSVWAWGLSSSGRINLHGGPPLLPTPKRIFSVPAASALAAGWSHSMVVDQ